MKFEAEEDSGVVMALDQSCRPLSWEATFKEEFYHRLGDERNGGRTKRQVQSQRDPVPTSR